jgi:hypothetical protein
VIFLHKLPIQNSSVLAHERKIDIENLNAVIGRSRPKMEKREQRFVITFLWLRGERPRQICQELFATLGNDASFEAWFRCWVRRFASGDTRREDISRAGRPLTDLVKLLRLFFDDYPFASARVLSRHFNVSATTVKEILAVDLGFRRFSRRWLPHTLSDPQKVRTVEASIELLHIFNELEVSSFDGITTGEE